MGFFSGWRWSIVNDNNSLLLFSKNLSRGCLLDRLLKGYSLKRISTDNGHIDTDQQLTKSGILLEDKGPSKYYTINFGG